MPEQVFDIYWEGNEHSRAPSGQRYTYVKEGRVWVYFYNKPSHPDLKWKFKKKKTWWQERLNRPRIKCLSD